MKFTIARAHFLPLLASAKTIAARKTTIPVLCTILISADADRVEVTATDLDQVMQRGAEASVDEPGSACFPAFMVADFVAKLGEGAEITVEEADGRATLRAGRARLTVSTLPEREFPTPTPLTATTEITMTGNALWALLSWCEFAMSNEETRYYLKGIAIEPNAEAGLLTAVATDGHRLGTTCAAVDGDLAKSSLIIIPRGAVAVIIAIAKAAAGDLVSLAWSDVTIRVEYGDTHFRSKLVDGSYPDWRRVCPPPGEIRARADGKALATAIGQTMVAASADKHLSAMTIGDGAIGLSIHDGQTEAESAVEAECEGNARVGVNIRYLAEIASQIGDGPMTIAVSDPSTPVLFVRGDDVDSATFIVLMPMRI